MINNNDIHDTRLHSYLRGVIDKLPVNQQIMLKSVRYCGSKIIKDKLTGNGGVFLLQSNSNNTKFWGTTSCNNTWYCPVCSARMMSKYASKIASLIEAMYAVKKQSAFMLTLTLPHHKFNSQEEITEILYQSWKDFVVHGNTVQKYWKNDVFANFCQQMNCTQRVRVAEYTYGKSGWHPHFHCLFFVDDSKFNDVHLYEYDLQRRWEEIVSKNMFKWLKSHNERNVSDEQLKFRIENIWQKCNTGSKAAYISKDDNGEIIKQKSSMYICGWGADKELTGNYNRKANANGHYTPYQVLLEAADGNEEFEKIYVNFMLTMRKNLHKRVNFSKGAKKIISEWRNTQGFTEYLKKKQQVAQKENWQILCWFNEEQWYEICNLDKHFPIKSNILYLATLPNARDKIQFYLQYYDIYLITYKHFFENLILNIFNSAA